MNLPLESRNTVGCSAEEIQLHVFACHEEIHRLKAALTAQQGLPEVVAELEVERMKAAAVMTASIQNTERTVKDRITQGHPYWSQGYADVCRAVDREMELRAERDDLRSKLAESEKEVEQLKGAIALGQYNCDAVYDDLRDERDLARAETAALKFTIVTTIGGTVEGAPTHELNYLQRLRELVATEQERDAAVAALRVIRGPLAEYVHGDEEIPPHKLNDMLTICDHALAATPNKGEK